MKNIKALSMAAIIALAGTMPSAYAIENGQKFKDWEGLCEKFDGKDYCGITQTVFDAEKKPVVQVFIRKIQGQKDPLAFVKVPLGVNLQAGIGLAVDKKELVQVPYTVCDPAGCNAIVPLKKSMINKLKAGNKMQVGIFLVNQEVVLDASLSGITNALNAL